MKYSSYPTIIIRSSSVLDDGVHDIKLLKNMKNHMQEYEILYKMHQFFFGPDFFYFWTKAAHYGPAAHP